MPSNATLKSDIRSTLILPPCVKLDAFTFIFLQNILKFIKTVSFKKINLIKTYTKRGNIYIYIYQKWVGLFISVVRAVIKLSRVKQSFNISRLPHL